MGHSICNVPSNLNRDVTSKHRLTVFNCGSYCILAVTNT